MKELRGVCAALCTPFDETGETLDETALRNHIDAMIEAGVHGVVLCAGTGEFAYLRAEEKRRIVEIGIKHVEGRVPVVVQTSAITTVDAGENSKFAEGAGADALLILPPYFEAPGTESVVAHYERISRSVNTPIVVYNIPQATGFEITPELFSRMLEFDNVAYVKDMDGCGTRQVGRELHKTFLALRTVEKPVVCQIDGLCLGAGLEFALSCDFMIASDRSRFGLPNILRGIPAIVEAAILPMAIGIQGTRELAYLGEFWDAEKAERRGLVQTVTTPQDLSGHVDALCAKLAEKSPQALGTQKEIIHKWMTTDLESAIDFSINTVVLNWLTKDQKEGMSAFLEKREATFKGE